MKNIAPAVFHNRYMPEEASQDDVLFVFQGKKVLTAKAGEARFPAAADLPRISSGEGRLRYLFRIDDRKYFMYLPCRYTAGAIVPFCIRLSEAGFGVPPC